MKKNHIIIGVIVVVIIILLIVYYNSDRYKTMKKFGFTSKEYSIFKILDNCQTSSLDSNDESTWNSAFKKCGIQDSDLPTANSVIKKIKLQSSFTNLLQ